MTWIGHGNLQRMFERDPDSGISRVGKSTRREVESRQGSQGLEGCALAGSIAARLRDAVVHDFEAML
jgi:hypothetical protein